jgi:beta-galactosidase
VPVAIDLPPTAASGTYALRARVDFGGRRVQTDAAGIDVLPPGRAPAAPSKLALFDPKGATAKLLDGLGVKYQPIRPDADLGGYRALVIGREAIGPTGRIPDLARVRDGLKVLVFEQTAEVLSRRLGFRINVHGMRQAFVRAAGHPAVAGLADRHLRNWRGAATLTPPHLDIWGVERSNPTWSWCGFRNTRVWRCGNWDSVTSVLIEKPPRGNWLPIVDCGFDLQYAPLLEYAEGRGRIVFCQMDVTGRTESDPAACRLCANLLAYLDAAGPAPARKVHYAGDARGADLLRGLGVTFAPHAGAVLGGGDLLVAAPGAKDTGGLKQAVERGLSVLCLGLSGEEIQRLLPGAAAAKTTSAVSATMKAFGDPALRGISNAELHWRTKLTFAALAPAPPKRHPALRVVRMGNGCVVFCQAAPWMFDTARKPYLRTTYRRNVFLVSRLLNNLGAGATCPLPALAGREGGLSGMALPASWRGRADRGDVGRRERWFRADLDDSAWRAIRVPGAFDEQFAELKGYDGLFWYRLRFRAPANLRKDGLTLRIGAVDDESWVWLNGRFLGEVTKKTNPKDYWAFPRQYPLPPGLLKHGGENVLVVRVNDTFQTGGIQGVPALTSPGLWLRSHYLQTPQADDDPYRYYRW